MLEYLYDITLQTELGEKHGTMCLRIDSNQIEGYLNVLDVTEPCYGEIDRDGNCSLRGQIITLMRTIDYIADGTMDSQNICLVLHSENNTFQLTGGVSLSNE